MQETFGKYRLMQRLAFGGMAEVFLGQLQGEAGFSKTIVIKRLHPRLSEDHEFTRMLIDEARITSQLVHTNICQVLDLGQVHGSYFIAMEYVPGEDLRTVQDYYRRQRLHMPPQVAVYIVSELLAGLDYAHRKEDVDGNKLGVIHRDISPQNLLVGYEGEVKIIDFGIAKARQRLVQTQAGVIKGKFRYMSPEQALGGRVDHRTDLFAAGVVLYELLRGEPHSLNVPDTEVLRRMRDAEFEPLQRDPQEVPPELVAVVRRALHKSPRKRFQGASEFRQQLVQLLPKLPAVFADRTSPFGREELALLMKQIFPVERRRKRSGDSSQRQPQGRSSLLPPRQANHQTSGMAAAGGLSDEAAAEVEAEREAALVAASGRLPRDSTDHLVDDVAEPSIAAPADDASPPASSSGFQTHVGEPSAAVLAGDVAATQVWSDEAGQAATVAAPRGGLIQGTTPARRPDLSPRHEAGERPAGAPAPRPRGRRAGAFSLNAPSVIDVSKHGSGVGSAAESAIQKARQDPPVGAPEQTVPPTTAATGGGGLERPRAGTLRWVFVALAVILLGGSAFYVGRHGVPDFKGLLGRLLSGDDEEPVLVEDPDQAPNASEGAADAGLEGIRPTPRQKQRRFGKLRIESEPSGAAVRVCGKPVGRPTPVTVRLPAGRRCDLRLEMDGYRPYRARVRATGGRVISVKAELRPAVPADTAIQRSSSYGVLVVTSIRKGTVYVNGQAMGTTPRVELRLAPGQYAVWMTFANVGSQTGTRTVYVRAGQEKRLHFTPTM